MNIEREQRLGLGDMTCLQHEVFLSPAHGKYVIFRELGTLLDAKCEMQNNEQLARLGVFKKDFISSDTQDVFVKKM